MHKVSIKYIISVALTNQYHCSTHSKIQHKTSPHIDCDLGRKKSSIKVLDNFNRGNFQLSHVRKSIFNAFCSVSSNFNVLLTHSQSRTVLF